jgi:hypothetical protein
LICNGNWRPPFSEIRSSQTGWLGIARRFVTVTKTLPCSLQRGRMCGNLQAERGRGPGAIAQTTSNSGWARQSCADGTCSVIRRDVEKAISYCLQVRQTKGSAIHSTRTL